MPRSVKTAPTVLTDRVDKDRWFMIEYPTMKRLVIVMALLVTAFVANAEVQVIGGKKYECRDGLCMLVEDEVEKVECVEKVEGGERVAQGYMRAEEFIAFLENREVKPLRDGGLWLTLLLALLGGLAMNLTPCVLPMVPINLMIIGRSAGRGAAYGLGVALAYGLLGVGAAVGGLAFGDIQGNPWFNAAVAVVFVGLALALFDVWFLDFSHFRPGSQIANFKPQISDGSSISGGFKLGALLFPFGMGALSAVLAGACVAPVLVSVLLLTADLVAKGNRLAILLPFVMGVGMALPWPFAGAGMRVLPKPGGWMKWVNRVFGVVVLGFAAYYGQLAIRGWTGADKVYGKARNEVRLSDVPQAVSRPRQKPLLIDCWATWCKNCWAMDAVMADEKVKKALERFEVIHVQAEDISELRKLKGFESIRGLPAFVIFE